MLRLRRLPRLNGLPRRPPKQFLCRRLRLPRRLTLLRLTERLKWRRSLSFWVRLRQSLRR